MRCVAKIYFESPFCPFLYRKTLQKTKFSPPKTEKAEIDPPTYSARESTEENSVPTDETLSIPRKHYPYQENSNL